MKWKALGSATLWGIFFFIAMIFILGFMNLKVQSAESKVEEPIQYDDALTIPVESNIVRIRKDTFKEPNKNEFDHFYEADLRYDVYLDKSTNTVFAEILLGKRGLLIYLVDSNGEYKTNSSENTNKLVPVSINEDGLFYVLEDEDTGVQYIVSEQNSYLVRHNADGSIYSSKKAS